MEKILRPGIVVRYELLGIIAALVIQTLAAVWWASAATTTLNYMKMEIVALKLAIEKQTDSSYTRSNASQDFLQRDNLLGNLQKQVNEIRQEMDRRLSMLITLQSDVRQLYGKKDAS